MNGSKKRRDSTTRESHPDDPSRVQESAPDHTILDDIVADTRELVARRKRETPRAELEQRPLYDRTPLNFGAALRQNALAVIAEIKKASPSKGIIRPDFDVATFARHYEAGGAAALSVLTEPMHFKGHPKNLTLACEAVDLPLLRKDFIIDPYQLVEAKAYGADAVLLIAAVLERQQLYDLHQAADELGLACLVEIYDEDELDKVDFDQVQILGVNNRDLRTFEVDLNHAPRVFERVPDGVTRVAESGLKTPADLAHLQRRGVDAVLIGETLMRAEQPAEKLRALRPDLD